MDHAGMDHGGHTGHMPDHGMPCKMSMLWHADPRGTCLVFPSLQITSTASLVFYLVLLVLLSMLTEYLRLSLATFDRALRSNLRGGGLAALAAGGSGDAPTIGGPERRPSRATTPVGLRRGSGFPGAAVEGSEEALLGGGGAGAGGRYWGVVRLPWFVQLRRSAGYTLHVALTFYIMLLVMSYNAQIIGAIILGAFLGHFVFQRHIDLGAVASEDESKGLQCH
ncbi:copper transpport protein [Rhodotorula kratochvilovae]